VGTRLGRYEIIRTLAKGALTDLLLGRASGMEGFERHVAIKQLHADHAKDPAVLEMFVNEARLAAALHHHNIVQVLDIGDGAGEPYFAMEYVHGVDLRTLLGRLAQRGEQLPVAHVVSIVASAAAALHHAHDQKTADGKPLGIVHRQVTPGNILVGYDGNVKIVDFGIAKAAIKRSETGVGVLRGSAPYMAPEQCAGQRVDRRSDVFALGIVLYELSTVRRLFKGANEFLTMSAVVNAEVPRPSQYRRDIPPPLEVVMLKALARDPLARFQTAGDMADALDRVARQVGVGASTTQLANYMKLQFGAPREPWLIPELESDPEVTDVDFDGQASGLAPPPNEAIKNFEIPKTITATKGSPIQKARTFASTPPSPSLLPDGPFNVSTSVETPRRATTVQPSGDEILDLGALTASAAAEPPMVIAAERKRAVEMTEVVEPLSVVAARAETKQAYSAKRSTLRWVVLGIVAVVGAVLAIILWPSSEIDHAAAAPAKAEAPPPLENEPAKPAEKSGLDMTARDYDNARAKANDSADAAVEQPAVAETPDAASAETPAQKPAEVAEKPADKPTEVAEKPTKQAVRPASKPTKRTTTKPVAKRTTAPAKKPTKKPAKPKWNPDDLFLGE
jgi:serine/threonine protein kinase